MAASQRRKFTPEFRDEAVRLVLDTGRPIAQVARDIGVLEGTLGNCVNLYRSEHVAEEPELSIRERAELAQLRRDNGWNGSSKKRLRTSSRRSRTGEQVSAGPR